MRIEKYAVALAALTLSSSPNSIHGLVPQNQPSHKTTNPVHHHVERMTAEEFRRLRQHHQHDSSSLQNFIRQLDRPIIISNAMAVPECEDICEQWIQAVASEVIPVQRKKQQNDEEPSLHHYDCTVSQALDVMMESKPGDSVFAFVEGLLNPKESGSGKNGEQLQIIQERLNQVREDLFPNDSNWFDHFPSDAKPSDCIVMAGEGATSTLHRDPFEWTGTSLCLEGRKIWRFLPSEPHIWDDVLQSYRLESIAWTGDNDGDDNSNDNSHMTLSAGWQSDYSLYELRQELVSAQALSELPEQQVEEILQKMASTTDYLKPNIPDIKDDGIPFASVVQHPGEMLLIPPYMYHQTYAPEPSLAVASQRCGTLLDARRVIRHILDLQPPNNHKPLPNELQDIIGKESRPLHDEPKQTVKILFDYLQSSRNL